MKSIGGQALQLSRSEQICIEAVCLITKCDMHEYNKSLLIAYNNNIVRLIDILIIIIIVIWFYQKF